MLSKSLKLLGQQTLLAQNTRKFPLFLGRSRNITHLPLNEKQETHLQDLGRDLFLLVGEPNKNPLTLGIRVGNKANHRHRADKRRRDRGVERAPPLRPRHAHRLPKKESGPGQQKQPFSDSAAGTAESNTEQNPGPPFRHRQQLLGNARLASTEDKT